MRTSLTVSVRPIPFGSVLRSLRTWCVDHLVQTVPEEFSVCEYECQEPRCNAAKSAICEKRMETLLAVASAERSARDG